MASSCDKSFSSNYMLLKPEKAGLFDIFKILFSGNISNRIFVECPNEEGQDEPFGRRWIIFLSILVQKFLVMVAGPMARFGAGLENWFNLLNSNGGFFRLVRNSIRGKVIYLDKTSASFVTLTGYSDTRLDLDSDNMKPGDSKYHALLSLMASKVSYENKNFTESIVNDHWKMNFVGSYDFYNDYQKKATTQAFLLEDNNDLVVVAFRGTEPFDADAWSSDIDLSWYELPGVGRVHGGFMKALGLQESLGWPNDQPDNKIETAYYAIRRLLKEQIEKNDKVKFIVTGHSLGGALAALFPAILGLHEESLLLKRLQGVYTFGQPRVGDGDFAEYMKTLIETYKINWYRFVYCFDIVPRLPYDSSLFMFKHFGTCVYYNSFYEGKIVKEEPNKNYFALLWLIPKSINAVYEFIRSFTIPFTKGPIYRESGVMRMFRLVGLLLVAGIPAHYFQDYHNSTRLGSHNVFPSTVDSKHQKTLKNE